MDRQSRIRQALAAIGNPAYLTAIGSVGEYKRAVKELEKGRAQIEFDGDRFRVRIGGETVTLGETPDTFRCTCPSPVVCRHIVAAVMAVAADAVNAEEKTPDAPPLEPPDPDAIRALFGEKTFRAAVSRYAGSQIELGAGQPLTALVNGYRVAFLSGADAPACSCKKSRCEHAVLALLKNWSARTGNPVAVALDPPDPHTLRLIDDCLDLMAGLLDKGMYAATQADARLLLFYSLNLSRYATALGKNLRSLSLLLDEVLENRMFADETKLNYHFCRAFNLLRAVASNPPPEVLAQLVGSTRQVYRAVGAEAFVSLGVYPFLTDSGYVGAVHLLCGANGVCALSALLPTIYDEQDEQRLYQAAAARADTLFPALAGHKLVLRAFKTNASNGLSLTDDTVAEDKGAANEAVTELDAYETDYAAVERRAAVADYFAALGPRRYAVVPYARLSSEYDPSGVVRITLTHTEQRLTAALPCNAATRRACETLLSRERKNGVAVLEDAGGEYVLRTLLERGHCVPLYFEEGKR